MSAQHRAAHIILHLMTPQLPTHMKLNQTHSLGYWQGLENQQQFQPKLWEPDPFDGSNSHNLHFHLTVQTELPRYKDYLNDNTNKVNYVLSFLKGTALDCFGIWIH